MLLPHCEKLQDQGSQNNRWLGHTGRRLWARVVEKPFQVALVLGERDLELFQEVFGQNGVRPELMEPANDQALVGDMPLTLNDVGADHRNLFGPIHGQAYAGTMASPNGIGAAVRR
jgi:hypothetical protein